MTPAERARQELARLRRLAANPEATPFEREDAQRAIKRIEGGEPCRWCLEAEKAHNGAVCAVLARFQRRHGKGNFPGDEQARSIREDLARDAENAARAERRQEQRARQGKLFG